MANTTVMSIQVSFTQFAKVPPEPEAAVRLCKQILELFDFKMEMLFYIESKMAKVAPNVCEIIGPKVTSKLVSAVGGIEELSRIPACNLLVIGAEKRALNGLSSA